MNEAVSLKRTENGIAIVALEDRVSKNTFSGTFVNGLLRVFAEIDVDTRLKAVVVHGYDSYFCCGGTKEELLNILEGKLQFTDAGFYDVFVRCKIPVIAAMQGHALGGGLALGCFADMIVLSEESLYSANFMRYGFTPGMGATYIIPRKFGECLGAEMLLAATSYHGGELRNRGATMPVVKREKVIETALGMAREIADKPRVALMELKRHLVKPIREALPGVIESELAMHRITFAQPEVRGRIETRFGS